MQKEARFERTFCSTNIISQPFLEVTGWYSHLFIFSLISGFEAKIIIPCARYIVNKILCKY